MAPPGLLVYRELMAWTGREVQTATTDPLELMAMQVNLAQRGYRVNLGTTV